MSPSVQSIHERLEQAQQETQILLLVDDRPSIVEMDEVAPPESPWAGRQHLSRYLEQGHWKTAGPGFGRLQEWVEEHWNPQHERQAPKGTAATMDQFGRSSETQLDDATATRKLIAAAKLHGRDQVGECAARFAAHGTIESRSIYLLKGPPIEEARALDDHSVLLPYSQARREVLAEVDPGPEDTRFAWPEADDSNVCALETTYYERVEARHEYRRYASPLLAEGPENLTLLLGLVWGNGFRIFANWHYVPAPTAATLPYGLSVWGQSTGSRAVTLRAPGYGPPVWKRPLAIGELHDLAKRRAELPLEVQQRLSTALSKLRNSTERLDAEDRALDLGIALQVLFTDEDETENPLVLAANRSAWFTADSVDERQRAEDMLGRFFTRYSRIVHGRTPHEPSPEDRMNAAELLAGADEVLRASLKLLIADGWPDDWDEAANQSAIRRDPTRPDAEILSVKSDSLSWSVAELRLIDEALEAEWKPVVDEAPIPPAGTGPATVSGQLPKQAASYREREIPYVVIHPARLYMAHPMWPRLETDPLDERAEFYCTRDVERHLRRWSDAAARKGLIQFQVPTGSDLYHPKHRHRWAQPLLSSHEACSDPGVPDQQATTSASLTAPTRAQDTERPSTTTADKKPAAPQAQWPASVALGLEKEWLRLWDEFRHDVNVTTDSLLHLLEAIHEKHLAEQQRLNKAIGRSGGGLKTVNEALRALDSVRLTPVYPKLRALPSLSGEPLFKRTAPDGPMEQSAFKAWVQEVWDLWESRYRTRLKHATRGLPGVIRPRQHVLGDLRHIRNNLLHNGIAKGGEAANCKVLRWFEKGERMQVRLRHVFDFLNQMGWLTEGSFILLAERGATSLWHVNRTGPIEEPTPPLISVRPLIDPDQEDPRFRYEASMVFENGVFGRTPMGPESEGTKAQTKERRRKWMRMTVNADGDLHVPDLGIVSAAELYRSHLKGERHEAPGIWSPLVQFRE